jgi:hypothetical protein
MFASVVTQQKERRKATALIFCGVSLCSEGLLLERGTGYKICVTEARGVPESYTRSARLQMVYGRVTLWSVNKYVLSNSGVCDRALLRLSST